MKKYLILFIGIFFIPIMVNAKELELNIITYGGSNSDSFYGVVSTLDGGYVAVGETNSINIDGVTNKGNKDAIIVMYDKDGDVKWQQSYGGSSNDRFESIILTDDGEFVVVGYTSSNDIDGLFSKGRDDAIIVKYDENGNMIWQKNYGGSGNDYFRDIVLLKNGGYVVVGESGSNDIGGITNKGREDAVIVKYDKDGNVIWEQNYGGSISDYFYGITESSDGNYIVVGHTMSSDINGITYKSGGVAIIVKYDENGTLLSQKSYDGNLKNVKSTASGGYVVVGSIDVDKGGVLYKDAIILKYDSNGQLEWENVFAGNEYEVFSDVINLNDGGYVVVGYSSSTDIDGLGNRGYSDGIIVQYDKGGNLVSQENYGGNSGDCFNGIDKGIDGGYVAVGYALSSSIESVVSNGGMDGLIVSMLYRYSIIQKPSINGSFNTTQAENVGKIEIWPDDGYTIGEIIITNSLGERVNYYDGNGYYYFYLNDDVVVEVIFKQMINPDTGVFNPYVVISFGILIASIILLFVKKRKYI